LQKPLQQLGRTLRTIATGSPSFTLRGGGERPLEWSRALKRWRMRRGKKRRRRRRRRLRTL
jgi:hypothetical protein